MMCWNVEGWSKNRSDWNKMKDMLDMRAIGWLIFIGQMS